ncbi:MAG: hypothetical protein IPK92_07920 [Nitrospira sp.]|nr:hypothetical protein [Nitrospira sp.]MBL8053025.1 hypothetical protein [Nitrospira sp.]
MRQVEGMFLSATILVVLSTGIARGDMGASPTTWKCLEADGTSLYTNKERTGCQAMDLKPLSVVPDLVNIPTIPRTQVTRDSQFDLPPARDRESVGAGRPVPEWARDWYASNTASGSVQAEACTLYMEWMHLVQKTRGGMFFGIDPSYGGDITGRNQRGASHSFYDNARYIALSRLFGTGFVPVGCF